MKLENVVIDKKFNLRHNESLNLINWPKRQVS